MKVAGREPAPVSAGLRIGSLSVLLYTPRRYYMETLAESFSSSLEESDSGFAGSQQVIVTFTEGRSDKLARPEVPEDGLVIEWRESGCRIYTEALTADVDRDWAPAKIQVDVLGYDFPPYDLKVHLTVVFTRILFALGRIRLHAAAVSFDNKVSLFIGDKGAGKSSICIALARRGGNILADDDVIVWKTDDGFVASGCDETLRMLDDTERHFFGRPPEGVMVMAENGVKKQIQVRNHFRSAPFRDFPIHALFFVRVGKAFVIRPATRLESLLRLMNETSRTHRVADRPDHQAYLAYLSQLVNGVPSYHLELSSDLSDLGRLAGFVSSPNRERDR